MIYFYVNGTMITNEGLFKSEVLDALSILELNIMRYDLLCDEHEAIEELTADNIGMQNVLVKRMDDWL